MKLVKTGRLAIQAPGDVPGFALAASERPMVVSKAP
jgi:hypothetical protein